MKARIVNGREAERKARKRAKKWRIAVTIRLISCRKCWKKEEEGVDNRTCYDDTSGEP